VIRRTDQGGGWVTNPGHRSSYTRWLQYARKFPTRAAVEAEKCPGNEIVERFEDANSH